MKPSHFFFALVSVIHQCGLVVSRTSLSGATPLLLVPVLGLGPVLLPSARSAEASDDGAVVLRWKTAGNDSRQSWVEVSGLRPAQLRGALASTRASPPGRAQLEVFAEQGDVRADLGLPPMLGEYSVADGTLRFTPRFPLERGTPYRAIFRLDGRREGMILSSVFRLPELPLEPSAFVAAVYPSADELPENLLKFYVHFSKPMRGGRVYDHIHLLNERGRPVELPFLEIDEELWDPAMTRLTLFIDPGRIKRGVQPLEEIGPALEAGKVFQLVIDQAWQDDAGAPMTGTFVKEFRVGPPVREAMSIADWKIHPPAAGSAAPLKVRFPRPMDHALAMRVIVVHNAAGQSVRGKVSLAEEERVWMFRPEVSWNVGTYRLVAQTTLEDLAGNNIGKAFEVDQFERVHRRIITPVAELSFEIPDPAHR